MLGCLDEPPLDVVTPHAYGYISAKAVCINKDIAFICCAEGGEGSTPGTPSGQPGLVSLRQFCELMEEVLATRR